VERGRAAPWRLVLALALLTAAGWALRQVVMVRTHPVRLQGDEYYYVKLAGAIASGQGHFFAEGKGAPARAWRPPAQAFLLSLAAQPSKPPRWVRPEFRRPMLALEVAVGALLVPLTFLLARSLFDRRAAWIAAVLVALHPTLVGFSHYLWSETLFATLLAGALWGVAAGRNATGLVAPVFVGAVFGLAALTREIALGVAAAAALVVLPWTLRNERVLGRAIPVATVGWFAVAEGNTLDREHWLLGRSPELERLRKGYFGRKGELERMDFAHEFALEQVAAAQPAWIFKKLARNLALLLEPDSFVLMKVRKGAYGDVSTDLARALVAITVATWLLLLVCGSAGVVAARGGGRALFPIACVGVAVAVHVLANASTRFRVPWIPLFAAYAGQVLAHPRETWTSLDRRRRILLLVGLAAALSLGLGVFGEHASATWAAG